MKDQEEKELNELAPTLFGMNRPSSGTVPQGYFDELPARMMEKIRQEEQKARVIPFYRKKAVLWSAAASIVILFGINSFMMVMRSSREALLSHDIQIDDLNIHEFDEAMIMEYALNITPGVSIHTNDLDINELDESMLLEEL